MTELCGSEATLTGEPCTHPIAPESVRCAAGHLVAARRRRPLGLVGSTGGGRSTIDYEELVGDEAVTALRTVRWGMVSRVADFGRGAVSGQAPFRPSKRWVVVAYTTAAQRFRFTEHDTIEEATAYPRQDMPAEAIAHSLVDLDQASFYPCRDRTSFELPDGPRPQPPRRSFTSALGALVGHRHRPAAA